jgi:hypothetical protein
LAHDSGQFWEANQSEANQMSGPYSIVNSILENIVTTVKGIDRTPNFVNTISAAQVKDSDLDLDRHISEMHLFPFFCVINGENPRVYEPSFTRNLANFQILCTFKNSTEKEMNLYIDDIERALAVDITRGTQECWESKILSVAKDSYRVAEFRRWIVNVQCVYGHVFGQPGRVE